MIFSGETYEYFPINERSVLKLDKFIEQLPAKDKVEFVEAARVKFKSVRQAKLFFVTLETKFKHLQFLTIQHSSLCHNFILQLKTYIDNNESLISFASSMNKIDEIDFYDTLESCFEHPNLEIVQLCDKIMPDEKSSEKKN